MPTVIRSSSRGDAHSLAIGLVVVLVFAGGAAAGPPVAPATPLFVSIASDGALAANGARDVSLSDDGRYAVFVSASSNLVQGDTNGLEDIFLHDRVARTTVRVSIATDGREANNGSYVPVISGDGHVVAFVSDATNLVAGDTNQMRDVFVRDLASGQTIRVNVASDGSESRQDRLGLGGMFPSLSRDGRFVAFSSAASDLVPSDTNGWLDVFVKDRTTGIVTRESVGPGGVQADGASTDAVISADGQVVAFGSWAQNLAPIDTNITGDVFVRDRVLGTTTRVSVSTAGGEANGMSGSPRISGDGRLVLFWSEASNLAYHDTNQASDLFVHERTTARTTRLVAATGPHGVGTYALAAGGRYIAYSAFSPDSNGCDDVYVFDRTTNLVTRVTSREEDGRSGSCARAPALDADGRVVAFEGGQFVHHDAVVGQVFALDLDSDDDTMPDAWETVFGLDALNPADALVDADHDGRTNAQEFAGGTHPRASVTRYFAEGASSVMFDTRFALLNPGDVVRHVELTFQGTGGERHAQVVQVGPHARTTVRADDVTGIEGWEFATTVESDGEIVADRLMQWDHTSYGSHLETAIVAPSLTWYFAEGATHSEFQLFYLLQNPDASSAAEVEVTFLRPGSEETGAGTLPIVRRYTIAPHSRLNVWVNLVDPLLARSDVSASIRVVNDVPIIAERALYKDVPHWDPHTGAALGAQFLGAGTVAAGVTSAATTWYLAEGATGWLDEFVLIANPGADAATVDAQFLLPDGTVITNTCTVAAESRFTIWVNDVEAGGATPLAATAHATVITSTNGVPVVVERAMWWPSTRGGWWEEGHSVVGATAPGTTWAFAEGDVGGSAHVETYILIASLGAVPGVARVTLMFEDGSTAAGDFALPAHSRVNVQVAHEFPEALGRRFGAVVESLLPDAVPILVERSMYSDANGVHWAAGAAAMATRLPQ